MQLALAELARDLHLRDRFRDRGVVHLALGLLDHLARPDGLLGLSHPLLPRRVGDALLDEGRHVDRRRRADWVGEALQPLEGEVAALEELVVAVGGVAVLLDQPAISSSRWAKATWRFPNGGSADNPP